MRKWRENLHKRLRFELETEPLKKWYRKKFNLTKTDKRYLSVSILDIEEEFEEDVVWKQLEEDYKRKLRDGDEFFDYDEFVVENGDVVVKEKHVTKAQDQGFEKITKEEAKDFWDDDDLLLKFNEEDKSELEDMFKERFGKPTEKEIKQVEKEKKLKQDG